MAVTLLSPGAQPEEVCKSEIITSSKNCVLQSLTILLTSCIFSVTSHSYLLLDKNYLLDLYNKTSIGE